MSADGCHEDGQLVGTRFTHPDGRGCFKFSAQRWRIAEWEVQSPVPANYGAVSSFLWCDREHLEQPTPGLPDPALIVGQWRDIRPDAMWQIPNDMTLEVINPESLEQAYATLCAAVRRIIIDCLAARERWANNNDPAHAGAAVPRAVAYQHVASRLHRAYDGATAIHQPKEHP